MLRDGSPPATITALPQEQRIDSPNDPLVGTVLQGTYAIDRFIGSGGMSHIYEAHHVRLAGHRFAVKILLGELADNQELVARFQREIAAVARIDHPRVVRVYDCGVTPHGRPYMVTELLVGMDLSAWLGKFGPLPVRTALHVGQSLAEALRTTHAHGVIHRDLKPSNVFLVGDFSRGPPAELAVKILDFGLSRFLDRDDELTKTRLVMGTPAYMSPEQANGERGTHLSDIYGLGAVLYAAVTGEAPFSGGTPQQTVLSVLGAQPVRPRKLEPTIPEGLEVVIQCCMAKRPQERYQEVRDVERSLANLAGRPSGRTLVEPGQAQPSTRQWPMRVQFLMYAMLGMLWLASMATTAVSSAWTLRSSELILTPTRAAIGSLGLVFALALGTAFTLYLRREVWPNSPRLLTWMRAARGSLVGATVVYGVAGVLVQLLRWVTSNDLLPMFTLRVHASQWPGWPVLFAFVSVCGGSALGWTQWQASREGRSRSRAVPWIATACVLLSVLLLIWGGTQSQPPQIAVAQLAGSGSGAFLSSLSKPSADEGDPRQRPSSVGSDETATQASPQRHQSAISRFADAGAETADDAVVIDIDQLPMDRLPDAGSPAPDSGP